MSGRRGAAVLFAVASGAYLFDRVTKIWVEHTLAGRPPIEVIPGALDLRFTTNSGGAFSIGERAPWLFVAATLGVSIAIVASSFRHRRRSHAIALGLVLGGALGNLTDRIVRGPGFNGRVVDFVDVHIWPIFNAADAAIVLGAIVLGWSAMRHREDGDTA